MDQRPSPAKHLVIDARGALPTIDGMYMGNIAPIVVARGVEQRRFRTTLLSHPAS